jgi:hypothetical protein
MSAQQTDIVLKLRTLARLIETKAAVTWREQDAAHLRNAADELERLRAVLSAVLKAWDAPAEQFHTIAVGNENDMYAAMEAARATLKEQT